MSQKRRTVSLCMIVRNEGKHLNQCLESVKDLVDEMIVCDTGSDDDTVAIAERHGAKVIHFEWCQDFAAARNASCEPATGDVIFTIDGDEYLDEESHAIFREEIERLEPGQVMSVPIFSFFDPERLVPEMTYASEMIRLHWNSPQQRWHRPVHVQVVDVDTMDNPPIQTSRLKLYHYGYLPDAWNEKNKQSRIEILERLVEEEPDKAHNHYFLAKMHAVEGRDAQAAEIVERAIRMAGEDANNPWIPSAHTILCNALLQLGRHDEHAGAAARAAQRLPDHGSLQYHLAIAEFMRGDVESAAKRFEKIVEEKPTVDDQGIISFKCDHWLGRIALLRGKALEAIGHFDTCLQHAPKDTLFIGWAAEAHAFAGQPDDALKLIEGIDDDHAAFVRAICDLVKKDNDKAIPPLQSLLAKGYRTRSTGLYLGIALQLTEQYTEAESIFRDLIEEHPEDGGFAIALINVLVLDKRVKEAADFWMTLPRNHSGKKPAMQILQQAGVQFGQG